MVKGKAAGAAQKPRQAPKEGKAPKPAKEARPGDNSGMSDEQRQALLYNHVRIIERLENAADEAKRAVKQAEALLRADGFSKKDVRDVQKLRSDAGQKAAKAEVERQLRLMRWSGVEVGQQMDLFPTDRRPAEDKAFAEGRLAGLEGRDMKAPYAEHLPQGQAWMKGWHAGQDSNRELLANMKAPKKPEPVADDEFERSAGVH